MKRIYPPTFSSFWELFKIKLEEYVKEISHLKKCSYCKTCVKDYSQIYCQTCGSTIEQKRNLVSIENFLKVYFRDMNLKHNRKFVELRLEIEKLEAIVKGLKRKYKTFKKFPKEKNNERKIGRPERSIKTAVNWAYGSQKNRSGGWDGILYFKS